MAPFAPSDEYICIICKIMQLFKIGNSLTGDELAIAQQLIFDILTCIAADTCIGWGASGGKGAP